MNVEQAAKICHEVNRAFREAIGEDPGPSWKAAPVSIQHSAISGVKYHLDSPDALPVDSHNEWLAERRRDGWQYGPEKDATKKLHPNMVPYDQLPKEQRAKDYIFAAIVRNLEPHISRSDETDDEPDNLPGEPA